MDMESLNFKSCIRFPERSNKLFNKEEALNCLELVQIANGGGNVNPRYSYETSSINNLNPSNSSNISLNNSFNNLNTLQNNINSSLSNNQHIYNFDRVFSDSINQEEVYK